jgi:hypothetical protein
MKEREIDLRRACLYDGEKALDTIIKSPNLFSPQFLVTLAEKHRGVAIHINANDDLKNKIDRTTWLKVMSQYSWDAAIEYDKHPDNLKNKIRLLL